MAEKQIEKKHICYYIDTDIPTTNPSIVHVMKMCQAFVRNGCDVTVHCNSENAQIDEDAVFAQYGITDRFRLDTVCIPAFLRKHGHRLGAYYSAWVKTRKTEEAGLAYSRSAMALFFLRKKMPFVYEAHLEPDIISRWIERRILLHGNCRGLVVITRALKKRYLELFPFFPEEKITVLHDAADPEISGSTAKAVLRGNAEEIKIGYAGSLFPGKCMETILPLAKSCPQYRFHIVGGTEYWVDFWKKQAQEIGVDNLVFYGFVENSKLGDYYRAFDISILPFSRNVYIGKSKRVNIGQWTSPLKLFEAMAYGKPILVSRLATIEEVMTDGVDCVMVEPDNIVQWAQKLETLCEDAQMQEKIGNAAREKLEREYTWLERARKAASLFD